MMRQYLAIKARHPDAILFYRMGDFYELFGADAELAAPLLDITLTTRDRSKPDAVPMCGVPVHGADPYVKRLAELGYRVAICEQVEAPSPGARKLVRREVVEVITPGLVGDPDALDAAREVSLVAIDLDGSGAVGLAALEASTGELRATEARAVADAPLPPALLGELERIAPREILVARAHADSLGAWLRAALPDAALTAVDADRFDPAGAPAHPEGLAPSARDAASRAAAALLHYLGANQPFALPHAERLARFALGDAMALDAATRAHLELFESSVDRTRRGTLIERVDATVSPLGARRLARWIAYPLLDPETIRARQDAVSWLVERDRLRAQLRERLRAVRDLERLLAKAARPSATPRDLGALRASLAALPAVAACFAAGEGAEGVLPGAGDERPASLPVPAPVPPAHELLERAFVDDPPAVPRGSRGAGEIGAIREGFDAELDALRASARDGRAWIASLEARERERTGIPSLKIRFHPVHGYGIELSKAQLPRAPGDYERKQTLANAERFTTPELREMEGRVVGAHERAAARERELFERVRAELLVFAPAIRAAAARTGELDALASFAEIARRDGWTRPLVDAGERLEIRAGRHPVIEALLREGGGEEFVANDAVLDPGDAQLLLLTGPNMSGKSTYLRQVALLVLLAQTGSFVPAESMRLGVVDRIFTRVGASDRLARGESTFMVEMRETAEILAQATRRSLVILDEIGRGTSTFDGLSIAWAVAEHLHDAPALRPRTLFATHYHELTDLAATKSRLRNAHFAVREWGHDVVFLRRLVEGGASRSYGIQVARLAGLPEPVIARARQVLARLEAGDAGRGGARAPQLSLFEAAQPAAPAGPSPVEAAALDELRRLDADQLAPLDALVLVHRLAAALRKGETS
jgi:DNA mismatch repair protein MutS